MGVGADEELAGDRSLEELEERLGSDDVVLVDALNDQIEGIIENAPDLRVDYVVGDASDVFVSSGGHLHFDVVHEGSSIHCVVFAFRLDGLEADLEDGLQIAVRGDLSYHEDEGQVSILGEDVLTLGEGLYERTYQQNREALAEDGLLDDDVKRELPAFPERIGIVTSAESDAREDAVTSIHGRYPDVDIVVHNAAMQGTTAMESMMAAISALDDDARIDVIVLTRGGGADKHLRVFNETPLCRVAANTQTPITAAVGHENDRSLVDEVADRRVMTPTHVGEIVPEKAELEEDLQTQAERFDGAYRRTATLSLREHDQALTTAYSDHVTSRLDTHENELENAFKSTSKERLLELEANLDHAYDTVEQQAAFEQEKAAVTESYEQKQRRRQAIILALVALIAMLLAYIVLT
ncbi:exodeoxyribonuclease VII large subunit [Salinarchaeum laminariae]|uniref:exodeoxyribonuclease VII large subunit n=1 Tax=Salinarchaeum laminariae TaxID=869888 RepID=UPI0020C1236F|nr:exodeoxyribonuclease VII large subunit [Salinarchaeum laminariae]